MPGPTDYAQSSDVLAYLPNVPTGQQSTWISLISIASRAIDGYCRRYFYSDGAATKYFDVSGDPFTGRDSWPPSGGRGGKTLFVHNHDFYSVTAIKVAQVENGNPASSSDGVTLSGDGVTPPSDFFLEPGNGWYIGKNGDASKRPYYWFELPAYSPSTSTSFRGYLTAGKRTVSITATWGWPSVPDEIRDIAVKIVVRMFKAQPTGFTGATGSPEIGMGVILKYLDVNDLFTLDRYQKKVSQF
jgi:hypothetical protein